MIYPTYRSNLAIGCIVAAHSVVDIISRPVGTVLDSVRPPDDVPSNVPFP